jgi:hypothetical protein
VQSPILVLHSIVTLSPDTVQSFSGVEVLEVADMPGPDLRISYRWAIVADCREGLRYATCQSRFADFS